jgi:hypothetical protein
LVLSFFLVFFLFWNSLNWFKRNNCQAPVQHRRTSKKSFFHLGKGKEKRQQSFFKRKNSFVKAKKNRTIFCSCLCVFAFFSRKSLLFLLVFFQTMNTCLKEKPIKKRQKKESPWH